MLTESLAITNHIARQHGGALGPQDAAEAALIDQWTLFAATAIEAPALEIMRTVTAGTQDTPAGQAVLAKSVEQLERPLRRLEGHLATTPWLIGGRFTVADINLAECLRYAQSHPTVLGGFPAVKAWLETCQSRAAFQKMWAARMAEPA